MNIISIIPARIGSSRFPGKPLASICGTPMLGHVYNAAKKSKFTQDVYIATCDHEIKTYASSIGAKCIMTSCKHERCSDRTAEALIKIELELKKKIDIVVMIQGDEPMITGVMIDKLIAVLKNNNSIDITNLMSKLQSFEEFDDLNEVKVVIDKNDDAIYFSREAIPSRRMNIVGLEMMRQVGVIAFKRSFLIKFNSMKQTLLERIESIDMLRLIENGHKIRMVESDAIMYSVDTPDDLEKVISYLMIEKSIGNV